MNYYTCTCKLHNYYAFFKFLASTAHNWQGFAVEIHRGFVIQHDRDGANMLVRIQALHAGNKTQTQHEY
jgi:hypothetical protein